MRRSTLKRLALMLVAGASLFQTVTCNQIAADAVGGATSSILNQYIRSVVNDLLGTGSSFSFGLGT